MPLEDDMCLPPSGRAVPTLKPSSDIICVMWPGLQLAPEKCRAEADCTHTVIATPEAMGVYV